MSFKPLSPSIFTLLAKALYGAILKEPPVADTVELKSGCTMHFKPIVADNIASSQRNLTPLSDFLATLNSSCFFPLILEGRVEDHIVFAEFVLGDNEMHPQLFISDSKTVPENSYSKSSLGLENTLVEVHYVTGQSQSGIDATTCGYRTLAAIMQTLRAGRAMPLASGVVTKSAFDTLMLALQKVAKPAADLDDDEDLDEASAIARSIQTEIDLAKSNHDQSGILTENFLKELNKTPATKALESASLAKQDSTTTGQRVLDFIGFPKKGTAQRAFYFLSLAFVFRPIISSVKVFTELLPMILDKAFGVLESRLKAYTPLASAKAKNPRAIDAVVGIKSGARSLALGVVYTLRGVFATIGFIGGLLTSPIETASRLWQGKTAIKNPIARRILAIGSGLVSIGMWSALLFFALPAILPALAAAIPAIAPAISALLGAFSTPLLALAAGTAAILSATIIRLGNVIAKKIDAPSRLERALIYDLKVEGDIGGFTDIPELKPREPGITAYTNPVTGLQELGAHPVPGAKIPANPAPQTVYDPDTADGPPPRVQ